MGKDSTVCAITKIGASADDFPPTRIDNADSGAVLTYHPDSLPNAGNGASLDPTPHTPRIDGKAKRLHPGRPAQTSLRTNTGLISVGTVVVTSGDLQETSLAHVPL